MVCPNHRTGSSDHGVRFQGLKLLVMKDWDFRVRPIDAWGLLAALAHLVSSFRVLRYGVLAVGLGL